MKPKTVTHVLSLLLLDWTFSLSSGHSQDKVRLGYSGLGSGEEIHHLAKDLGLFRKHNVEGETIRITGGCHHRSIHRFARVAFRPRFSQ